MKVSIITATYNSGATLRATLDSVAAQSAIADIEHIIIDSRSNDTTLTIVAQYPHIKKVISEKDRGIYHAFNLGVQHASGELIYFLNSDDTLLDANVISDVQANFTAEIDFYCGVILFVDSPDGRQYLSPTFQSDPVNFKPRHQAFFCRRTLFDQLGLFNECLNIAADTYFMKDAMKRARGVFTNRGIARFSLSGMSSEQQNVASVIAQDSMVDSLLGVSSIYSDMSDRLTIQVDNLNKIKNLFLSSLNGQADFSCLREKKVGIFGTRELSLIYASLFQQQQVELQCFVVSSAGEEDAVFGKSILSLEKLEKGMLDVVINCVEGSHEQIIDEKIRQADPSINVLSWRRFCEVTSG